MAVIRHEDPDCDCYHGEGFVDHGPSVSVCRYGDVLAAEAELASARDQLRGAVEALAKADGEVTALADALRAAGVKPTMVQAIIDNATPRGQ